LLHFIKQENKNDCLLACLAMILTYFNKQKITIHQLKIEKNELRITESGLNLKNFKNISARHGILTKFYQLSFKELTEITFENPVIIVTYDNCIGYHALIIFKSNKSKFLIADPNSTRFE
jgi:ABC-type bacteriocin/lantibiotic exporter with double-glycine peptidase domain